MRNIFVEKLIKRASKNKNIFFLTADLGYNSFEVFQKKFPDRFINVGVAENNMIGIATGLALLKKEVYVYSIVPFLVFRSLEQIRNNICHNNLNIKIMGGGGGFSYGDQGISHNTSEDLSIMNTLPNLKIFTPSSIGETELIIDNMFLNKGPSYMRLGKVPLKNYNFDKKKYKLGEGIVVNKGNDVVILSCGNILGNIYGVIENLEKLKISCKLISFPCIKPLNEKSILKLAGKFNNIIIIEENIKIGGFGTSVKEIFNKFDYLKKIKHIGLDDKVHNQIGSQKYLRKINKLDEENITKTIVNYINERKI